MRKAALLYNPDSGGSKQRQRELQAALEVLQRGGVEAELVPTSSPEQADEEARRFIAKGCDTIFACGGDGTIHNTVQVLANTSTVLAILPMGTANALAHDLGIPLHAAAAAQAALQGRPRRVALGRVTCPDMSGVERTLYFVITAGIGVDAHLFYKLQSGAKQRLGMAASTRRIPLSEIAQARSITYSPLADYGGFGVRWGSDGSTVYNVRGDRGVEITLRSGERIIVGSRRSTELERAIAGPAA